jgi:hypothetical protein
MGLRFGPGLFFEVVTVKPASGSSDWPYVEDKENFYAKPSSFKYSNR